MKAKRIIGIVTLVMTLFCFLVPAAFAEEAGSGYMLTCVRTEGADGSYIDCPVLTGGSAEVCEKVNALICENAMLARYESTLAGISGGSGLRVSYTANTAPDGICPEVLSILICADGRQPQGRPGTVYYTVNADLATGGEIFFSALCNDMEAAEAFLDEYAETVGDNTISDYMENRELVPVPTEHWVLDGCGHIVILYEKDAFSFLSGQPGSFAFSPEAAKDVFDLSDGGVLSRARCEGKVCLPLTLPGKDAQAVLEAYRSPLDSFFFDGGEMYLTEEPLLRGAYLIMDDTGERIKAVLMTEVFPAGLIAGETGREEIGGLSDGRNAEESITDTVENACVALDGECEGVKCVYYFDADGLLCALLALE